MPPAKVSGEKTGAAGRWAGVPAGAGTSVRIPNFA
jgi:hypothetical protein